MVRTWPYLRIAGVPKTRYRASAHSRGSILAQIPLGELTDVVECKGVNVLIAHMMKGSLSVKKGDIIEEGQKLGKVGNSGNTFEPHLHIDAVRSNNESLHGKSVPMLFHGRFLSLNSMVKSTD